MKKKRRPFRGFRVTVTLLLAYVTVSLIYFYLPWSIRKPVYQKVPDVDYVLRKGGFKIISAWDELALIGKDSVTAVLPACRGDYVYGGFPSQGYRIFGRVEVLKNQGFVTGYSETMKNPLWVCYRVFDVPKLHSGKRPSRFSRDPRSKAGVCHDDYTRSGYDRGHMAPNYAIATRYGRDAQLETFLMTNIIPQVPSINRYLWKDIEMNVAKRYGRYFGEVWVITGPVFQRPFKKLASGVPVPSGYYKIIVDETGEELRAIAFLVDADSPPYTRIKSCLVSIDEIEERTGLNFFPDLPDTSQEEIESKEAGRLFPWVGSAFRYYKNKFKQKD